MANEPRPSAADALLATRTQSGRRIRRPQWMVAAAAAAVVVTASAIVVIKLTSNRTAVAPGELAQVDALAVSGAAVSSDAAVSPGAEGAAVGPPPTRKEVLREGLGSFDQSVADAAVIVVGTAVDSAPAPPKVPGDLPENFLRFRVTRVLKGKLADKIVTTRTPTAPGEFIGKEWIVMLSADNLAGKHYYARCLTIKLEPKVKSILAKAAK